MNKSVPLRNFPGSAPAFFTCFKPLFIPNPVFLRIICRPGIFHASQGFLSGNTSHSAIFPFRSIILKEIFSSHGPHAAADNGLQLRFKLSQVIRRGFPDRSIPVDAAGTVNIP